MEALSQARVQGLDTPPYPTITAKNGDYFQSPVTTVLLLPLSFLPLGASKFIAALYTTLGIFFLLRSLNASQLDRKTSIALLLLFTHALSDAYLSLNPVFITAVLLWASHRLSLSNEKQSLIFSGLCFTLALALRPFPALLFPFYLFSAQKRKVVPWIVLFGSLSILITFIFLPKPWLWWQSWLTALPLYRHAADVLHPAFQTPLSLVARLFVFGFNFPKEKLGVVEAPLALLYLLFTYGLASQLERRNKFDLAFSLLLASLYCSFATVWACGFFYCFPFVLWAFSQNKNAWPLILSLGYALLPQWAWPSDLWGLMMSRFGLQGLFILAVLILSWKRVRTQT
ncbi:MAG: glycosyltransferase 87 family protein [Pseudomonadota bacterium]